jgi:hypothetical protein
MIDIDAPDLPSVVASLGYLPQDEATPRVIIYPPSTGRPEIRPPRVSVDVPIRDCRGFAKGLDLEFAGFTLCDLAPPAIDYLDKEAVQAHYYPVIEALIKEAAGALAVFVFDHNVRSVEGAAAGRSGVRPPVGDAHDDYTETSGPRRVRDILTARGREDLHGHRAAVINAWRPLRGPVLDWPLAVCDARTVRPVDFVACPIEHYAEHDLTRPSHTGEVYSMRFDPRQRWFYVADMGSTEVLIFKCFDSSRRSASRFTPHTGFENPNCPAVYSPRESIEARAVVIYPEREDAPPH